MHSGNGSVYLLKPLDREESAWHNISVVATEFSECLSNVKLQIMEFSEAKHSVRLNHKVRVYHSFCLYAFVRCICLVIFDQ